MPKSSFLPKPAGASSSPNMNLPAKQRAPRFQTRADTETTFSTARIEHPILPDFVSMILRQEGATSGFFLENFLSYKADVVEILIFFSSVRQNQRAGRSKVVHVALAAFPLGSKPPATVVVRICIDERHDLAAAAPFSTTTSSLQWRAGGSIFTSKLVESYGPSWTLFAETLSRCIACTALAAPSVRS